MVACGDTESGDVIVDDTEGVKRRWERWEEVGLVSKDQSGISPKTRRNEETSKNSPPQSRLPIPLRREAPIHTQSRDQRQDDETDPVDVLDQVGQGDGGSVLLVLEGVGNVVVGDVDVGGLVGGDDGFRGEGG